MSPTSTRPGCETRAVLGRGEARVQTALEEIRQALPFRLRGIDSDNGSEFINDHLYRYCQAQEIQFTRGRPVQEGRQRPHRAEELDPRPEARGVLRYDTPAAVAALNALYRHELRLFQNLFLPSVKLVGKERVGARLRRRYDAPRTPLDRVQACPEADPGGGRVVLALRDQLDPFALSQAIDRKIERLVALATPARPRARPRRPRPASRPSCRRRRPRVPAAHPGPGFDYGNRLRRPKARPPGLHRKWLDDTPLGNILKWLDRGRPGDPLEGQAECHGQVRALVREAEVHSEDRQPLQ